MAIVLHQTLLTLEVRRVHLSPTLFYPWTASFFFLSCAVESRTLECWSFRLTSSHLSDFRLNRNFSRLADWLHSSQPLSSCVWTEERNKREREKNWLALVSSSCFFWQNYSVSFRGVTLYISSAYQAFSPSASAPDVIFPARVAQSYTLLSSFFPQCGFLHGYTYTAPFHPSITRSCLTLLSPMLSGRLTCMPPSLPHTPSPLPPYRSSPRAIFSTRFLAFPNHPPTLKFVYRQLKPFIPFLFSLEIPHVLTHSSHLCLHACPSSRDFHTY